MSDAIDTKLDETKSGLTPRKLMQTYDADEWEVFIEEWCDGFDPKYHQVVRLGGANDKGRDVVGHIDDQTNGPIDIYQCKHYDHVLYPGDVLKELGKLCVFTFKGIYPKPRRYQFVAPFGAGTTLYDHLRHPDDLKKLLITKWADECESKISKKEAFPLKGDLLDYVEKFDFSCVKAVTPNEIIDQHRKTRYWFKRFKEEFPTRKPEDLVPPEQVKSHEIPYIAKLLAAYADFAKQPILTVDDLKALPKLRHHLLISRGYFYSAESLARTTRDAEMPKAFDEVKQHVHAGVVDVTLGCHEHGYGCVLATTQAAATLVLPVTDLSPHVWPADRKGICHHLANEDKLSWQ